jgi:hypothetical protein
LVSHPSGRTQIEVLSKVLSRAFKSKEGGVIEKQRKSHNEERHDLYRPNIFTAMKSGGM